MLGTEALAGAEDRRHRLLRLDGRVHDRDAVDAQVAIPASVRSLAEIGEQGLAPAARRFAQCDERIEPLAFDALLLVRRIALLDLQAAQPYVAHAVEGHGVGRHPVAAGAPDLLIVALDVLRQVGVAHEAHVRLVDAHPERDGRHDHHAVLLQEGILVARARGRLHACVVRQAR